MSAMTHPGRPARLAKTGLAVLGCAALLTTAACSGTSRSGPTGVKSDSAGPGAPGKGVTDAQIKVGVVYTTHNGAEAGTTEIDQKAQAAAVIAYVNSHGKVAGRELAPVYQATDLAKTQAGSDEITKACKALTEDTTVFAVLSVASINTKCLIQHQTPIIASSMGGTRTDADTGYDKYGQYLYSPSSFLSEDQTQVSVGGLQQQGFFSQLPEGSSGPAKIGVITFGAGQSGIKPDLDAALARYDLKVADWGLVENNASSVPGIVLRFKSEGITHVLTPGYSPLGVAPAAQAQKYHPLYGLDSRNAPGLVESQIPAEQLEGATGVGWQPFTDVDAKQDNGLKSANAQLCVQIMQDAGLPTNANAMQSAAAYCDDFLVLQKSLDGAKTVNLQTLQHGYEAIGTWDSPATFAATLGPDRHTGADGYRDLAFVAECGCFQYQGPVHKVAGR